ncbi:putative cytochrome P450 [Hortaea werneckii]|nr:putative cytochrome P450 [Hortaea werneckii]
MASRAGRDSRSQTSSSGTGSPSRTSPTSTPAHRPTVPSGLRYSHMPPSSPEDQRHLPVTEGVAVEQNGFPPHAQDYASINGDAGDSSGLSAAGEASNATGNQPGQTEETATFHIPHLHNCGDEGCSHGSFSPRPRLVRGYGSFATYDTAASAESTGGYGGPYNAPAGASGIDGVQGAVGDAMTDGLLGQPSKKSTTHHLAKQHGVKNTRWMYLSYYLPITTWLPQYRASYLTRDLIAALTMSSFYIPISLSYASNLGHIPPINGLYSFVFNPLLYAVLGTCPTMVVGPEAAGSLLTGGVVKEAIKSGRHKDHEGLKNAHVAGMVTGLAGAIILASGLCRLGFLDSVLSRPFLRGFISAIGIVILVDQLIPEMGLDTAAAHSASASHGSSLNKIEFLFRHAYEAHRLTCIVAFSTIAIVLVLRELKKRLQPRFNWVAYIPDRFLVVVFSALICWKSGWDKQGLQILGDIRSKTTPFLPENPFAGENFHHVDDAFGTSFVIALLGFFESSVAAKSLGTSAGKKPKKIVKQDGKEEEEEPEGIKGMSVSANRELVALGVANLVGGVFMALPAFGGYGRSKVNVSTGGITPMSSIFLSLITVICILFLLPWFYYIPKATLSAMISVVAYSLIEEAPHDIHFFYHIGGYSELFLMLLIFLTTFFWNLRMGIAVGIGLSLLRLVRHSTRPRIQILGRLPGTREFENAESMDGMGVEFVPHCLIVKIPEPLTFANTGSLKDRLRRLEDHGTVDAHPALPKVRRAEHNQNVIFDVHGVTSLDPAAAQVLLEIVEQYVERGTRVFFSRVPGKKGEVWRLLNVTGIVELCGGERHFLRSVDEALRATERASTLEIDEAEEAMLAAVLRNLFSLGLKGPAGLPLLGNLFDLPPTTGCRPEYLHWLAHKDRYGPISSITVLGQTMVIIHDRGIAGEVLEKKAGTSAGRPGLKFAFDMIGWKDVLAGLPYGQTHRLYRKYAHQQLGTKVTIANEVAEVIIKILYGYEIEREKPDPYLQAVERALQQVSDAAVPGKWAVDIFPFLAYVPEFFAPFKRTAREWRATLMEVVNEPYAFSQRNLTQEKVRDSFVARATEQAETETGLGPEEDHAIKWTAASLYTGGADTSVSTLEAFSLAMRLYPSVQRKAQAELDNVLGPNPTRLPTTADRPNLPYLNAVVEEAQRWHPIAPMGLPHTTSTDLRVGKEGYHIPAGSIILPGIWWMTRDPATYHSAEEFKPERFLEPFNEPLATEVTFGYGRRVCPGKALADSTLFGTFAAVLMCLDIGKVEWAEGDADGDVEEPKHGFLPGAIARPTAFDVRIVPRSEAHRKLIESFQG